MEWRILMNTNSLQKKFPNIYRDFFARNDLVLSWCFNIPWWSSSVWHRSNHIRVRSKIPLKCYVWIKKTKNKDIKIKDVTFFNLTKKTFELFEFSKINKESLKVIDFLQNIISDNDFNYWLEIEILSETSRWHSLWFSWTSFSLIISWIFILLKELNTKDLNDYEKFIDSNIFKKIFTNSLKLDFISRYWNTIWENIAHTLYNKKEPALFFTQNFSTDIELDKLENIYYKYSSIPEKYKETIVTSDLPIEYYMIFTWTTTDTKQVEQFKKWDLKEFEKYKNFIKNDLIWDVSEQKNIYVNKFTDDYPIYNNFIDILSLMSVKTVDMFKRLYEEWYDDSYIKEFIDHINEYRFALSIVENQSSFADDFSYFFRKNKKNPWEMLWIMPAYSWKTWWWYIIVTKNWISRNTIEETINELRTIYPNIEIEYSSYLDWECSDWIKVEQYITEWVFSDYIIKDQFIYKNNKQETFIWDYNQLLEKEKEWVLFDLINNKIYINWEKLTSKEIHSQNFTIELIVKLLDKLWEDIQNKELSSSTYSKSKSEMIWKIIVPIIKVIEEKTWEKLPLICKWSLTDFYIKLDDSNLKISTIKKL